MKRSKSALFYFLTLFIIHISSGAPLSFAAFSTSDLTGTWYGHALSTGTSEEWEYSTLTVDTGGNFSVSGFNPDGSFGPETGTLNISSQGIITHEGSATFHGAMSSDKNIAVITDTWGTDEHDLMVFLKSESSVTFSASDLAGTWQGYSLASGDGGEGWEVAAITIESTGAFSSPWYDSGGYSGSNSGGPGAIQISSQGIITATGTEVHGAMSSDKNIAVLTETWDTNQYVLTILVKSGETFSQSDVKGKWHGHALTSGAAEGWMVGTVRVNSEGGFNFSYTAPGDVSGTESDILNIGADGKITITGSSDAHGAMSSDKNFLVITDTLETGVYGLMIFAKAVPVYNPALPLLLLGD